MHKVWAQRKYSIDISSLLVLSVQGRTKRRLWEPWADRTAQMSLEAPALEPPMSHEPPRWSGGGGEPPPSPSSDWH